MIGYEKEVNGKAMCIGVSYLPERKKPCLVIRDENSITKFASFNNELSARVFMDLFADFLGAPRIDWKNDYNVPMGLLTDAELEGDEK